MLLVRPARPSEGVFQPLCYRERGPGSCYWHTGWTVVGWESSRDASLGELAIPGLRIQMLTLASAPQAEVMGKSAGLVL